MALPANKLLCMAASINNYLKLKDELKAGADDMLDIIFSGTADEQEISMALYTLEEALFPNGPA